MSNNKKVNLSQDATAISFNYDNEFAYFCENIIKVFEGLSQNYSLKQYKKFLYQNYIEERGKTSDYQRHLDIINPITSQLSHMTFNFK